MFLWIFAAFAAKKLLAAGSDIRDRSLLWLGVCGLRDMQRGPADRLLCRHGAGRLRLGNDRWTADAAGIFRILEGDRENIWIFPASR